MSKLSIEQQVAQLTPEQKESLGKIYKKYAISIFSVIIGMLLLVGGCFLYFNSQANQAEERWNTLESTRDSHSLVGNYGAALSMSDEIDEAMDEYYDMKQMKFLSCSIVGCFSFVAIIIVFVVFKKKYPYFSEKKYTYLKKMQKAGVQV